MKKKIVCGLAIVMSVAMLGGCGSKKNEKVDLTLNEVLANAVEKIVSVESIEIDAEGKLEGKISQDDKEAEAKGKVSLEGSVTTKDPSVYLSGELEYECQYNNTKLSGSHTAKIYGEDNEEDGMFYLYSQIDDKDWELKKEDISEFEEALGEIDVDSIKEGLEELKNNEQFNKIFKLKDTVQTVDGTDCYLVYAYLDKEDIVSFINEESETDAEEIDALEKVEINFELFFDKETYYPVKFAVNACIKGDLEDEELSIDVKEFSLEIKSDINKAKVVEVPSNVKDEAVEEEFSKTDLSDILN